MCLISFKSRSLAALIHTRFFKSTNQNLHRPIRVHAILTNLQPTLCVGPQRDHPCQVWLNSFHDSSQEDENVKS